MSKKKLNHWHTIAVAATDRGLGPPPPAGWKPNEGTKAAFREWLGLKYIDGEWVDVRVVAYRSKNREKKWRRVG